ncbi:M24 family metallopeptidase [Chloroflexota bacterium]
MSEDCPYTYKGYPTGTQYPWTFPMPSEKERDRRWHSIRSSMRKHNIDCLIVGAFFGYMPSGNQLYYISNYVPYANSGTYIVFPLEGQPQLGVNNRIGPQFLHCASETSWINEVVGSFNPVRDIIRKIEQLKLENARFGIVGYRLGGLPVLVRDALCTRFPDAIFEDATQVMAEAMNEVSRTSQEELTFLKGGCEILDLTYDAVADALKPGVKECDLWAIAEYTIIKNGGWHAHGMFVTSGPNPTFPRAPASHSPLNPGDIAIFEIDAIYGGISPQICFALSLGRPNSEAEQMFHFCKELYDFSLVELENNKTFKDIELELAHRIQGAGYEPMTPQIHRYNMSGAMPMNSVPQPGDYFTVHPNFCNREYTKGAKFGDLVRITKDGKVERLQRTPAKLNII